MASQKETKANYKQAREKVQRKDASHCWTVDYKCG